MSTILKILRRLARFFGRAFLLAIFISIVALLSEYSVFPYLAKQPIFSHIPFFQKKENITIINNTTQEVVVSEGEQIGRIAQTTHNALVLIFSNRPNASVLSGVLVTSDGLIAAFGNEGTVSPGEKYSALSSDGTIREAEMVAYDPFTRLVFFKVNGAGFSPLTFSEEETISAGEKVVFASLSDAASLRAGSGTAEMFDGAFNIGGKALSSSENLEGVWAVRSSSFAPAGTAVLGYDGSALGILGSLRIDNEEKRFLLSAGVMRDAIRRASDGTLSERPYFGAYSVSLSPLISRKYNLPSQSGAWVSVPSGKPGLAILSGSPAQRAGLRLGDIIISFGGEKIDMAHPLSNAISRYNKGDTVEMEVLRAGESVILKVDL